MSFEQCKVARYFAWAGLDPGIKSPVILLTEARMEKLERNTPTCIRRRREYTNRNREYWEKEATVFG